MVIHAHRGSPCLRRWLQLASAQLLRVRSPGIACSGRFDCAGLARRNVAEGGFRWRQLHWPPCTWPWGSRSSWTRLATPVHALVARVCSAELERSARAAVCACFVRHYTPSIFATKLCSRHNARDVPPSRPGACAPTRCRGTYSRRFCSGPCTHTPRGLSSRRARRLRVVKAGQLRAFDARSPARTAHMCVVHEAFGVIPASFGAARSSRSATPLSRLSKQG